MIEKIIFNVLAFTIFILVFINLIRKNDTNYLYILAIQFVGILLDFMELTLNIKFNIVIKSLIYLISIILPLILLIIEYEKKLDFTEILDIFLAKIFHSFGKYKEEKRYLLSLIDKYPNNIIGHKQLAKLYEKENNKSKELEEYEKIIEFNIKKDKIYPKMALLYKESGMTKQAKQILAEALSNKPDSYEASMILADILCDENEYKDAIQIYTSALKYRPADYDLYYHLGMTYTMLNDFKNAKENYEKAAQINNLLFHAKYSLGQLSLIYGDLDEAKRYFEECINSEEVESGAYYYLARISIIKGELDKAINYANVAVEEDNTLYEKIQKDNIFVVIKNKVKKPEEQDRKSEVRNKLSKRELQIDDYLDDTSKLVGKLNNNDIQMIENVMKAKEKTIEERQEE